MSRRHMVDGMRRRPSSISHQPSAISHCGALPAMHCARDSVGAGRAISVSARSARRSPPDRRAERPARSRSTRCAPTRSAPTAAPPRRRRSIASPSEGVRFDFAHAHAVLTLPSHASILTGTYPFQHGLRDNSGYRLAGRRRAPRRRCSGPLAMRPARSSPPIRCIRVSV